MVRITVPDDLWSTSILPEGVLERWLVEDGETVAKGDALACVRINDSLHDVVSPASGRISITARAYAVVDPGAQIAELEP